MKLLNIGVITLLCLINQSYGQLENLKFDVELELDHFIVSNVRDLDGTEDLRGKLGWYTGVNFGKKINKDPFNFLYLNYNGYRNGKVQLDMKHLIYSNLTVEELRNIIIYVGGKITDDEGMLEPRKFVCMDCWNQEDQRELKFAEFSSTQASINKLVNNGSPQFLKFGDDTFFELNYYESGIKNDGWVKFMWRVLVKPHA